MILVIIIIIIVMMIIIVNNKELYITILCCFPWPIATVCLCVCGKTFMWKSCPVFSFPCSKVKINSHSQCHKKLMVLGVCLLGPKLTHSLSHSTRGQGESRTHVVQSDEMLVQMRHWISTWYSPWVCD